jgi:hypothetical protein
MAPIMRRLVLGSSLIIGILWAGAASADPANLNESHTIPDAHWQAADANAAVRDGMHADAIMRDRSDKLGPEPFIARRLSPSMQAGRSSLMDPLKMKNAGRANRVTARRVLSKVRATVRSGSRSSLQAQLSGESGGARGRSSSAGPAPDFSALKPR